MVLTLLLDGVLLITALPRNESNRLLSVPEAYRETCRQSCLDEDLFLYLGGKKARKTDQSEGTKDWSDIEPRRNCN